MLRNVLGLGITVVLGTGALYLADKALKKNLEFDEELQEINKNLDYINSYYEELFNKEENIK